MRSILMTPVCTVAKPGAQTWEQSPEEDYGMSGDSWKTQSFSGLHMVMTGKSFDIWPCQLSLIGNTHRLLSIINRQGSNWLQVRARLEKAMAPHSSTLVWKIPWTEEPGRLQSMGLRRVGHDWTTSLSLFIFVYWRRKWQPTPVFLPGESQWWRSLVGCRLWGRTESDTTEAT